MHWYIKGLSYIDAKKAVSLIDAFVAQKKNVLDLSSDERLSWENVSANISTQSVAVSAHSQQQIDLINVVLADNDCGFASIDTPFLYKTSEEKIAIIKKEEH